MGTLIWIALAFFVVALAGGLALAAWRGLEAWRSFKRLKRVLGEGVVDTTRRLAAMERHLDNAGAASARLDRARARLRGSLATGAVLMAAAGEAKDLVDRLRGVVPRK